MSRKTLGYVLLIIGIILLVLSLIADSIGIGYPGFNYAQIAGVAAGIVIIVVGIILASRKPKLSR